MSRCYVIGDIAHASNTVKLLASSGIEAKAFSTASIDERFFSTCQDDEVIEVIAIFCTDIKKDVQAFVRNIRERIASHVSIHILVQGSGRGNNQIPRFSPEMVSEVSNAFPMEPTAAANFIRRRWFMGSRGDTDYHKRTGGTVIRTPAPSQAVQAVAELPPTVVKQPAEANVENADASPLATEPRAPEVGLTKPTPAKSKQEGPTAAIPKGRKSSSMLEDLLKGLKKNTPLRPEPYHINIVGLDGTVIQLDPRRIRPLPDQPRNKDNPGFSMESLTELGENIKLFGQVEEVLVCPIMGDPDYDAQLIDGERRHKSCLLAGIMIFASVREDITPEMRKQLYLISVARNIKKAIHTTVEYVQMVQEFRGPDYNMTQVECAKFFQKSTGWVARLEHLATLHPEVLGMVGESRDNEKKGEAQERKLTSQLAMLLVEVPKERQLVEALRITSEGMNFNQARRHIINIRRDEGIKGTSRRKRGNGNQFQTISTLAKRSNDAFGVFGDMPESEMEPILVTTTPDVRAATAKELRQLAENLLKLARTIDVQVEKI